MNHITIDAHSRDVVQHIVETGAADRDCFAWQSQLRTYWDRCERLWGGKVLARWLEGMGWGHRCAAAN